MKSRVGMFGIMLCVLMLCAGCSVHGGYIGHSTVTDVQLNNKNFVVVDSVSGQASANYFLNIGPSDQNLVDQARRDMVRKADMKGKARAIINVTTDEKIVNALLAYRKTVYISGDVIEFTK